MRVLTPARRRGVEILDGATVDSAVRRRAIDDVARSNRWLGGLRATLLEIGDAVSPLGPAVTLLDVGAGCADIPHRAAADARAVGVTLTTIVIDQAATLLVPARERVNHAVCANGLAMPFRDASIDIVMCSQVLHHFEHADAERLLGEMNRVARHAVIVSDLRRSWFAALGFWAVSFPLRFHWVTRHDGVVSVLRGFTAPELTGLVLSATGATPRVRRRLGFRLTARWAPAPRELESSRDAAEGLI